MAYGAAVSAVVAVILVAVAGRDRRPAVLVSAAAAAFLMPLVWKAILRLTHATEASFQDLPVRVFPINWQDIGTGMLTLAGASLLFALSPPDSTRHLAPRPRRVDRTGRPTRRRLPVLTRNSSTPTASPPRPANTARPRRGRL